jgi:hypothetical protein
MTACQSVPRIRHPESRASNFLMLATLLGFAGIVSLFLPFTYDESPVSAVTGRDFWRLALPFFLAVPVSLASIRWIMTGTLSQFERVAGYVVSIIVACLTMSLYFQDTSPSGTRDWISIVIPPVTFISGGFLVIKKGRKYLPLGLNMLVSLQVAYLANCLLCLVAFFGEWQAGAYFALLTAVVYLAQIVVAFRDASKAVIRQAASS